MEKKRENRRQNEEIQIKRIIREGGDTVSLRVSEGGTNCTPTQRVRMERILLASAGGLGFDLSFNKNCISLDNNESGSNEFRA